MVLTSHRNHSYFVPLMDTIDLIKRSECLASGNYDILRNYLQLENLKDVSPHALRALPLVVNQAMIKIIK